MLRLVCHPVPLGVKPLLGLMTRYLSSFEIYSIIAMGRTLLWKNRPVSFSHFQFVSLTHIYIFTHMLCMCIFTELNIAIRSRVKIEVQCAQLVVDSLLGPVTRVLNNNYRVFDQQMHFLLNHKLLQCLFKIYLYFFFTTPTCFGPFWTILREYSK